MGSPGACPWVCTSRFPCSLKGGLIRRLDGDGFGVHLFALMELRTRNNETPFSYFLGSSIKAPLQGASLGGAVSQGQAPGLPISAPYRGVLDHNYVAGGSNGVRSRCSVTVTQHEARNTGRALEAASLSQTGSGPGSIPVVSSPVGA